MDNQEFFYRLTPRWGGPGIRLYLPRLDALSELWVGRSAQTLGGGSVDKQ